MDFKKTYQDLVDTAKKNWEAKNKKKLTNTAIAQRLRYDRAYFQTLVTGSSPVNKDHIIEFKKEFEKELDNQTTTAGILEDPAVEYRVTSKEEAELIELKAINKALIHAVAKLQAKVYERPLKDCLEELDQNTRINELDLLSKR